MPRETIEIFLSEADPYRSGAHFFAVVAYPDPLDISERNKFQQAIVRWTLEQRIELHPEWALNFQQIIPAYFSGEEKNYISTLKRGMKRLRQRHAISEFIVLPHLRAIDTGRQQRVDGFFPTVNNMSQLAGLSLGLRSSSVATVKSKLWKPSKPVAHAMCAYQVWQLLWNKWGRNPQVDKQLAFLLLPEYVEEVVEIAELFRRQLADITQFSIHDDETIKFATSWECA